MPAVAPSYIVGGLADYSMLWPFMIETYIAWTGETSFSREPRQPGGSRRVLRKLRGFRRTPLPPRELDIPRQAQPPGGLAARVARLLRVRRSRTGEGGGRDLLWWLFRLSCARLFSHCGEFFGGGTPGIARRTDQEVLPDPVYDPVADSSSTFRFVPRLPPRERHGPLRGLEPSAGTVSRGTREGQGLECGVYFAHFVLQGS
jgi:hypothetical protein